MKQIDRTVVSAARPVRRKGSRWLRYGGISLGIVLVLVVALIGFGLYWLVMRPLPQTSGSVALPGLSAEVKVVRDKWGVPHITASNASDLFMAQGYVHAQDRLWQMEFHRRIGAGRLSEVLGEAALEQDRFLRTLGLRRAAAEEVGMLSPEDKQILESYARGVNAFISTHKDNLPVEFTLLGFSPAPWEVLDSLTWGKVMAFDLGANYSREILRAALVDRLGAANAIALMSPTGTGTEKTPIIIPAGVSYKGFDRALALLDVQAGVSALSGGDIAGRGSNNWVVSGAKSVTGKPILSNDPHLSIRNPSIWYEIELNGGGYHVTGVSFAGTPGVISGHNERIAWGVTNVEGDTQDLFIEKLNPANPNQYEFRGKWEDLKIYQEEIKIKGKPTETLEVKETRHGPLLNGVSKSLKGSAPMALQWTALRPTPLISAVLKYNRASNWNEFRTALRDFTISAQNFVYADVDGNIGYQIPGYWPRRAQGDGLLPVPGWTGEYEWTGYVPFEELPSSYNPPANFIATANNRPFPLNPKLSLGDEFDPGWRAERITTLLQAKEKLSMDDMKAVLADVVSLPGQQFARAVANLATTDPRQIVALQRLRAWDGRMTTDSVPGALYKVTYQYVLENMFKARLGNQFDSYITERFHLPFVLRLLQEPGNEWWGEAGRDALLQKSLAQAVDFLTVRLGSNPDEWRWGRLHTASFAQTPIGPALPAPLQLVINLKSVETAGDGSTVAAASYRFDKSYEQTAGQSFRGVSNLANFDESFIVNSGGQSGQPFNKHYGDNIDDWKNGGYHPWLFSPAAIERQKADTLTLTPG